MTCLWIIGGLILLLALAVAGLLAIVMKAQQHDPGIE